MLHIWQCLGYFSQTTGEIISYIERGKNKTSEIDESNKIKLIGLYFFGGGGVWGGGGYWLNPVH